MKTVKARKREGNPSIEHFPGAWDEPWATLQFAVERLRVLRTGAATPGPDTVATIHLSHSQGEDIHRVAETIKLSGSRDSWLVIKNVHGTEPLVSGGIPLDLEWQQDGDILTGRVNATCGEMYYGDYRSEQTGATLYLMCYDIMKDAEGQESEYSRVRSQQALSHRALPQGGGLPGGE